MLYYSQQLIVKLTSASCKFSGNSARRLPWMCSLHRLKLTLKGEVEFPVLLGSIFIGGPAKHRRLRLTTLSSVYVRLVLLLWEAQQGTLCRAIQVQQTL